MKLIAITHRSIYDVDTHLHLNAKRSFRKNLQMSRIKLWAITVRVLRSAICNKLLCIQLS